MNFIASSGSSEFSTEPNGRRFAPLPANPNHELLTLDEIGDALRAKFPPSYASTPEMMEFADLLAQIDG
jgi:hypothetical protein